MITKSELLANNQEFANKTQQRKQELEQAFSLMLQKYIPKSGEIHLRSGAGSKRICPDGTLSYTDGMQLQEQELRELARLAIVHGFSVDVYVNSHGVTFHKFS